jgi:hypothetical protein
VQWYCFDFIEESMLIEGWTVPLVVNSIGLIMVIVHPQPLDDCPCFEDSIAFLSVVMGITTGRWTSVRYGLLPKADNPIANQGITKTAMDAIRDSLAGHSKVASQTFYSTTVSLLGSISMKVLIMLTGIVGILITRITVKIVCRVFLPPIFRFVENTLGFKLPRRHYVSSAAAASSSSTQEEEKEKPSRPAHKRQISSLSNEFFSHQSDPKDTDAKHWKADTRSADQLDKDVAQSGVPQVRPARAERSKVKFTLGDGSNLPVPFTHPNTQLPGDAFSERIAGALSQDEKQRQQRELENAFQFPTRPEDGGDKGKQQSQQPQVDVVQHYDVDVLTKVFVYHAIGMASGCVLPTIFDKLGWTS